MSWLYSKVYWHLGRLARALCFALFRYGVARLMEVGPGSALIFSPHQDDETLGCGGFIALKRRRGANVYVVFLTDGSRGRGEDSPWSAEQLIAIRRSEAVCALQQLDVDPAHLTFLDAPDGALASLTSAQEEVLLISLQELLHALKPDEVILPYREDNHSDHKATHRLVQEAIRRSWSQPQLLSYPIWALEAPWRANLGWSDLRGARYLPVAEVLGLKKAALREYRSQVEPQPPNGRLGLSPAFLELFLNDYELYLADDGP